VKTNHADKTASAMTEIAEHHQSEREKIAGWRLHVLVEAGYPVHLAERLAHSEVDLHRAVDLVHQGCDATVAAEILL
jgi:class 3 adenylate cyclase